MYNFFENSEISKALAGTSVYYGLARELRRSIFKFGMCTFLFAIIIVTTLIIVL